MSRVTKQQFQRLFANREMDVQNVDQQTRNDLWKAGKATTWALRQLDVNGDGKISGAAEIEKLYNFVDDFDRNGDRNSINTLQSDGNLTNSGKLYNILNLQFAEAGGTTEVTNDPGTTTTDTIGTTGTTEVEPVVEKPMTLGEKFATGGASSIDTKMTAHLDAIEASGVGLYYGDHSDLHGKSHAELQTWIDNNAIDGTTPPKASDLRESSCIAWAMDNVAEAYKAAGKTERWAQIKSIVRRDGMRGTTLAKELKKDGWESVYWNGNTSNTSHNGEHSYSAAMVKRGKPYYGVQVDHQVLNYEKGDLSGIDQLKEVPFFFGLARGGSHTFVGRDGNVNEFHWSHKPDSKTAIEETPLKDWGWGSGLIMVPPGTWPN